MGNEIANESDFEPVAILFEKDMINLLFSDLLEVRGIKTTILKSADELKTPCRVITEAQYYSSLNSNCTRCLLVGNKNAIEGTDAVKLFQPLTEHKIEVAINEFLK